MRRIVDTFLARAEELVVPVLRRLQLELPIFAATPVEALLTGTLGILHNLLPAVAECRRPTAEELEAYVELARDRIGRGIPLDSYLLALQMATRDYSLIGARIGSDLGVKADAVGAYTNALWMFTNLGAKEIVRQLRAVEVQRLGEADRQASAVIARITAADTPDSEVVRLLIEAGWHAPTEVQPFVAAPAYDGDLAQLRRWCELAASGAWRLIAVVGHRVHGLVAAPWCSTESLVWATIAVGPPALGARVASSSALAARALEFATGQSRTGVVQADEVLLQLLLRQDPVVSQRLVDRFVRAVGSHGPFGNVILDTVRTHLDVGARVEATAQALHVHQNTVRYRLERYAELTGADLSVVESRVAVWSAFEADRVATGAARVG